MTARLLAFVLVSIFAATVSSAQTEIPLWRGPAPKSLGNTPNDIPTVVVFLPKGATAPTSAIVICPGGGYSSLSIGSEGLNVAPWFVAKGVAGIVLKYRLPVNGYPHPVPMLDVQRAMRLVRSHAADWNINPAKVGVMGFSAGGHLAATAETHFDAGTKNAPDPIDRLSSRPDFAVLVYAVVSMKEGLTNGGTKKNLIGLNPDPALVLNLSNETQVTANTPPTLLVHSIDDTIVPIEGSRAMYAALQKVGVPSALQEYPTGGHGFGVGLKPDNGPPGWLDKAYGWLKGQGMVP